MANSKLMNVVYTGNQLLEELTGSGFFELLVLNNHIKKLTT